MNIFCLLNIVNLLSYTGSETANTECNRLIELGTAIGYESSTQYSSTSDVDGSTDHVQSEGRTSTNTFCQEGCEDDPIVKGIIERMTRMTSIPYDNFEQLQLVKYEEGQFYRQHHDFSKTHSTAPYGPRILTFFLYLNNVESGGSPAFPPLASAVLASLSPPPGRRCLVHTSRPLATHGMVLGIASTTYLFALNK